MSYIKLNQPILIEKVDLNKSTLRYPLKKETIGM